MTQKKVEKLSNPILWDLFCVCSVAGIWPRFIEPTLIDTTFLDVKINHLPKELDGFKILQLSDLHLNHNISDYFLNRLVDKCESLKPDLIALTGDFLCYGLMLESKRLTSFLNRLKAPYGCYAVLGNHDYASCISINQQGEYDILEPRSSSLSRAFNRLFTSSKLTKRTTERAKAVPMNAELVSLLSKTPFRLLHNATDVINVNGAKLNICGFGEYSAGRMDIKAAYQHYDKSWPGIILLHNPDGTPRLEGMPGDIILSGHTHGGQVNLPWLWKKFTLIENLQFKKGLVNFNGRKVYVNRGIGSIMPFRWFATPEMTLFTLR